MQREQVRSSNLRSVGYDAASQILEIQFNSGSIYQYSGVSMATYNGLMSASSHGKYFDRFIKNVFVTVQVN